MLLRVGLLTVTVSVLLAAVVALMVSLDAEVPAAQGARSKPSAFGTPTREAEPGGKLDIEDKAVEDESGGKSGDEPGGPGAPDPRSEVSPRGEEFAVPPGERSSPRQGGGGGGPGLLPVSDADWPVPTGPELRWISEPRYFEPDSGAAMTLTIEALGLYDVPIFDSYGEEALDYGVMHVPDTAYPWDEGDQKNVFLAGHRVGLPGTDGRLLFFALDELRAGDEIFIEDRDGNAYGYRVDELFRVEPYDAWVADTLVGRDMLTLQTCTYPTFEDRLIVRADRL